MDSLFERDILGRSQEEMEEQECEKIELTFVQREPEVGRISTVATVETKAIESSSESCLEGLNRDVQAHVLGRHEFGGGSR